MVTALVLHPVNYLYPDGKQPAGSEKEWAPVKLTYEYNPSKSSGQHTIHVRTPTSRGPLGEPFGGEAFGMVEQKFASTVGPLLEKELIRLHPKIRRGAPNVSSSNSHPFLATNVCCAKLPILRLLLIVYTLKGNITVISQYLQDHGLLLDHPTLQSDRIRLQSEHYLNPHDPPPGGFRDASTPPGGREAPGDLKKKRKRDDRSDFEPGNWLLAILVYSVSQYSRRAPEGAETLPLVVTTAVAIPQITRDHSLGLVDKGNTIERLIPHRILRALGATTYRSA